MKIKDLAEEEFPNATLPARDIENIRTGWSAWRPTAPPPAIDAESMFHSNDNPTSTNNKSPEMMLHQGYFGGSYFRSLFFQALGIMICVDHYDLPSL